jgi:hypothetical protein
MTTMQIIILGCNSLTLIANGFVLYRLIKLDKVLKDINK